MRFIDPDGMQGEDWVKRKDGSVVNDVNVTNDQQAVKNHGDGATSLGQSFTAINDKNEQISFNSDGTTTSSTMLSEVVVSSAENNVDKGGQANDAIGLSNDLHGGLMGVVATIDKTLENLDGFKTVGAAIDVIGRASGIVGAVQSVSQAIDNPTVGNILKAGLDIGLAAIKANPIVGIVDGVLSVTGVKDAAFKWVDGKVENYSVNKFLETQKVNTSNVQVK